MLPPGFLVVCISHGHFNVPFPLLCKARGFFHLCQSFTGRTPSQLFLILERPIPFPSCFGPSANANSALAGSPWWECIPSFAGFDTETVTGALGKSRRIDSSFSGMHFDGEKVVCFVKLSR